MKSASALSAYLLMCPKCGATTEDFPVSKGLGPKFCAGCKGMWFERGQLAQLVGTVHDVPDFKVLLIEANLTAMSCPSCKKSPLLEMPYAKGAKTMLLWCNSCGGMWLDIDERKTLQAIAEYLRILHTNSPARKLLPETANPQAMSMAAPDVSGPLGYSDFMINLLAIPAGAAVVWLANLTVLGAWILEPTRMWVHDMGHAFGALLGSYPALPLAGEMGSWFWLAVYFTGIAIAGAYGFLGAREKRWFPVTIAGVFFVAQQFCTFVLEKRDVKFFVLAAGPAGELFFAMLLIVSFYYRQPTFFQWNFWRYPILVVGLFSFGNAFEQWSAIVRDPYLLPWEIMKTVNDGDLLTLRNDFDWTAGRMGDAFLSLGLMCYVVIALHYIVFVLISKKNRIG